MTQTTAFGDADEFLGRFLQVVKTRLVENREIGWTRTDGFIQQDREAAEAVSSLDYMRSVADLVRWIRTFLEP